MRRAALLLLALLFSVAMLLTAAPNRSYAAQDRDHPASPASAAHPAGTDSLGRDRLTRVATACVLGFAGSISASAVATLLAALIGLAAAFGHPLLTPVLLLVCDGFLSLPWIFLLMMVRSGLPLQTRPLVSAVVTFLTLALLGWPACARAVHSGASGMRSADWMIQARACGLSRRRVTLRHVLPRIGPLLLPQFLISVPAFLMAEANLGTLGLGVSEPLPSWGSMLLEIDNSALLVTTHWVYLPIALLIASLVLLELLMVKGSV